MGKRRALKKVLAVAAVSASLATLGGGPALAEETQPCGPLTAPVCEWVPNHLENLVAQAEEAKDYAILVGDTAVAKVNEAYDTIKCDVLGECG